jgi:hypothetical protein
MIPTEQNIHQVFLREYRKQLRNFLLTTRFNNSTWNENVQYRKKHPKIGCIYCSPSPVSQAIPLESVMFILEMNNDKKGYWNNCKKEYIKNIEKIK